MPSPSPVYQVQIFDTRNGADITDFFIPATSLNDKQFHALNRLHGWRSEAFYYGEDGHETLREFVALMSSIAPSERAATVLSEFLSNDELACIKDVDTYFDDVDQGARDVFGGGELPDWTDYEWTGPTTLPPNSAVIGRCTLVL